MHITNVIASISGKGGPGKTTLACAMAVRLKERGFRVGIADCDPRAPNVLITLGVKPEKPKEIGNKYLPVEYNGIKLMSSELLLTNKGKYKSGMTMTGEFSMKILKDTILLTEWGDLDYLVCDIEPSPGSSIIGLEDIFPDLKCIIITTDDDRSISDCERIIFSLVIHKHKIIGIVGNMVSSECPKCHEVIYCHHCGTEINYGNTNKIKVLAEKMHIKYLGSIPFNPAIKNNIIEDSPVMKNSLIDKTVDELIK